MAKLIEINLLPPELKEKNKKARPEIADLLYLFIPLGVFILLILHVYLGLVNYSINSKYKKLTNNFMGLDQKIKTIGGDILTVKQFLKERVEWSEKLNILSVKLPPGIWFNELIASNKELTLNCSVYSLDKKELGLINKFLNNLKEEKGFSQDFSSLEFRFLQRKRLGKFDVVDFTLNGKLK